MRAQTRVVIIDDNPVDAFVTERVIRQAAPGLEVVLLYPPQRAFEYLRSQATAGWTDNYLVLVDLDMPGMDGWECIAELDKLPAPIRAACKPCILTASINPPDRQRAGPVLYLTKPLSSNVFRSLLPP